MFSCGAVIYVDRILKYAIRMKRIEFNSALVSDPLFTKCTYSVLLGNILVRVWMKSLGVNDDRVKKNPQGEQFVWKLEAVFRCDPVYY